MKSPGLSPEGLREGMQQPMHRTEAPHIRLRGMNLGIATANEHLQVSAQFRLGIGLTHTRKIGACPLE